MAVILKLVLLAFYVAAAASPFLAFLQPYSKIMLIFAAVLLVVHVLEFVTVRNKIEGGSKHFLPILLFGNVHWKSLVKDQ
ncbi:MAG: hypothetical protein ACPGVT_05740 [Maricaulaceae bacterium]